MYTLYAQWIQTSGGYGFDMSAKDSSNIDVSISYSLPALINSSPFTVRFKTYKHLIRKIVWINTICDMNSR